MIEQRGVLKLLSDDPVTETVPWITCSGRKGGSAVAAGITNALLEWVSPSRTPKE